MIDPIDVLSFRWFVERAMVGIAIGFLLRISEHVAWSIRAPKEHNPHGNVGFAFINFPQSLLFGLSLGYLTSAIIAAKIKNIQTLEISTYLLPAFFAFIAADLRELLRRISRV